MGHTSPRGGCILGTRSKPDQHNAPRPIWAPSHTPHCFLRRDRVGRDLYGLGPGHGSALARPTIRTPRSVFADALRHGAPYLQPGALFVGVQVRRRYSVHQSAWSCQPEDRHFSELAWLFRTYCMVRPGGRDPEPPVLCEVGTVGIRNTHLLHALLRLPSAAANGPGTMARTVHIRRLYLDRSGLSLGTSARSSSVRWNIRIGAQLPFSNR